MSQLNFLAKKKQLEILKSIDEKTKKIYNLFVAILVVTIITVIFLMVSYNIVMDKLFHNFSI